MLTRLSRLAPLRRLAMPILKATQFDFTIAHPWVEGLRVKLNSFRHKGYWFFRDARERDSMENFARLISPGDHVVEVGGHIGFITAYYAKLAGPAGRVTVFEPGSNNLPYIRDNIARMEADRRLAPVTLVEKAVGPEAGEAEFFEDDLTGQNNSMVERFEGLRSNRENAFVEAEVKARRVPVVRLDDIVGADDVHFIKIDVEGFELGVLKGMQAIIEAGQARIMVEVQADEAAIFDLFRAHDYRLFRSDGSEATSPDMLHTNMFALHRDHHAASIEKLGW